LKIARKRMADSPGSYVEHIYVVVLILLTGLVLTLSRFTFGIGGVTRLDDLNPWGFWMTFDLLCGIALSAGGFVIAAAGR
jgi:Ni/Fe-hydrogenase subunit HybB-like protein